MIQTIISWQFQLSILLTVLFFISAIRFPNKRQNWSHVLMLWTFVWFFLGRSMINLGAALFWTREQLIPFYMFSTLSYFGLVIAAAIRLFTMRLELYRQN